MRTNDCCNLNTRITNPLQVMTLLGKTILTFHMHLQFLLASLVTHSKQMRKHPNMNPLEMQNPWSRDGSCHGASEVYAWKNLRLQGHRVYRAVDGVEGSQVPITSPSHCKPFKRHRVCGAPP
jgi:hypothetical protein